MNGDDWELIDGSRTVDLSDVGAPDYRAATVISADGSTHLVLASRDGIGDETATYAASCPQVAHEQVGLLPIEFVKRITITRRKHRKG